MKTEHQETFVKFASITNIITISIPTVIILIGLATPDTNQLNWFPQTYIFIHNIVICVTLITLLISLAISCTLTIQGNKQGYSALIGLLVIASMSTTVKPSPIQATINTIGKISGVAKQDCWFPQAKECDNTNEETLWDEKGLTDWGKEQIEIYRQEKRAPLLATLLIPEN